MGRGGQYVYTLLQNSLAKDLRDRLCKAVDWEAPLLPHRTAPHRTYTLPNHPPTHPPTHPRTYLSTKTPTNQPNQPTHQPTNQTNQPTNLPTNLPTYQPTNQTN